MIFALQYISLPSCFTYAVELFDRNGTFQTCRDSRLHEKRGCPAGASTTGRKNGPLRATAVIQQCVARARPRGAACWSERSSPIKQAKKGAGSNPAIPTGRPQPCAQNLLYHL